MRRVVVVLAGAVAAAILAAGCGSSRRSGPSVSPCFRVLPEAHAAVGAQGAFVDVARIRGSRIDGFGGLRLPVDPTASTTSPPSGQAVPDSRRDVCLIAYRGAFDPALIPQLRGDRRQGTYAVVVVGVRSQVVRSVFLTDELPRPLRRH